MTNNFNHLGDMPSTQQVAKRRVKEPEDAKSDGGGLRAEKSARRRQDILQASRDVLSQGYADFSMRKVAAAAGVHLNTVQHHFGDLEALVAATVNVVMEEYLHHFRELATGQFDSASDDFAVLIDEALSATRDATYVQFSLELWAMALHSPSIAVCVQRAYEDYRSSIAQIAKRINPALSDVEAGNLATLVAAWTEGAVVLAKWGGEGMPSAGVIGVHVKAACLAMMQGRHLADHEVTPSSGATATRRGRLRSNSPSA